MSLLTKLIDLFKAIFGGKKPEAQVVEEEPFNLQEARKKLSDSAKTFMLAGHNDSEKASILRQVELNEKAGNNRYIVEVDSCYYKVGYGNFTQYRKGEWMNPTNGKMSQYTKDMVTIHQENEKDAMLKQIADNEAAGIKDYNITFSVGYFIVKNNKIVANM